MEIRSPYPHEWDAIHQLVMSSFDHGGRQMRDSFPYLFDIDNQYSKVAIIDEKVVSFIGVVPIVYQDDQTSYLGVSIGSVCTSPAYRGQRIADHVLKAILTEQKEAGASFVLISGSGKLYLRNHAQFYGHFKKYLLTSATYSQPKLKDDVVMKEYEGTTNDTYLLYKAINQVDSGYPYDIHELPKLIKAQGLANVMNAKQKIYLLKDTSGKQGYMIVYLVELNGKKRARIYMYTPDELFISTVLDHLFTKENVEEVDLHVQEKQEKFLNDYLKNIPNESEENAGSIIELKNGFLFEHGDKLSHSYSLKYI